MIDLTVFTEVCRMIGDLASTAPARTLSMLRSLTMLIAGTPYLASKAGLRMSRKGVTAMASSRR